jgi:hypothetical protein
VSPPERLDLLANIVRPPLAWERGNPAVSAE